MVVVLQQSFGHGEPDPVNFSDSPARFSDDLGSAGSTPFVSAPSSPRRCSSPVYFFSAPASPTHFFHYTAPSSSATRSSESEFPKHDPSLSEIEFDFSSRLSSSSGPGSMISADELFSNGQIKPMKLLSSLLQRPMREEDGGDSHDAKPAGGMVSRRRGRDLRLRSSSVHRKASFQCEEENGDTAREEVMGCIRKLQEEETSECHEHLPSAYTTPSCSSGRNSMKWIFLNNLLHRSKSEGRANGREKFWSNVSFSTSKEKRVKFQSLTFPKDEEKPLPEASEETQKHKQKPKTSPAAATGGKPTNGIAKRRGLKPSAHELHYTTNRAQAEEMKKRTYLPYRHGLFGCLGFSSKGCSALNGFARSLNSVSSR